MHLEILTKQDLNEALEKNLAVIIDMLQNKNKPEHEAEERFLTIKEAAQFLNVSETTLWSMRKNENLPVYKIGKKVLLKKSELLASMEKFRNE